MASERIEYKANTIGLGSSVGGKKLDEMEGIVECFVAGIGNKDSVGDIVASGAFTKSLQRRKPRVVWGHNWNDPIGKVLEIYEVPTNDPRLPLKMKIAGIGGLFARVQFNLNSDKGKEAFASVAFFGEEQEWSIGYKTLKAQFDQKSQANVIYELELYEVSPVLHGANQLTGTISVKADEPYSDSETIITMDNEKPNQMEVEKQLAYMLGTKISILGMDTDEVTFSRNMPDGTSKKFKCGWSMNRGRIMFGAPQEVVAPKPMPTAIPMGMPGVGMPTNEPRRIVRPQQMPSIPVAIKPGESGVVMVPLPPVQYESAAGETKPKELDKEESDLRDALLKIVKRHGKFNEDADGVWAGYKPAMQNPVAGIGVKCSNCVFYQKDGSCKIIDMEIEPEGKCRFAIIPPGVVKGDAITQKEYEIDSDREAEEFVEDIETKYPGEFILSILRGAVGKRKKKRRKFKSLADFGKDEQYDDVYCIHVHPHDAFAIKQELDPIFEYHMVDTEVHIEGIVIKSGVTYEFIEAVDNALQNIKKKSLDSKNSQTKALGRRLGSYLGSRLIDRPNISGRRGRTRFDIDVPTGGKPGTRRPTGSDFDPDADGWVDEGTTKPRWIGLPSGESESVGIPLPMDKRPSTARPLPMDKRPSTAVPLPMVEPPKRRDNWADLLPDRHDFPNKPSSDKDKKDFQDLIKKWNEKGYTWQELPRLSSGDEDKSINHLRGREIGHNQVRAYWKNLTGKNDFGSRESKDGEKYFDNYFDLVKGMSSYLFAVNSLKKRYERKQLQNKEKGRQNIIDRLAGQEEGIRKSLFKNRPNNTNKENSDMLRKWMEAYGFGYDSPKSPENWYENTRKKLLSSGRMPDMDENFDPDNPYIDNNGIWDGDDDVYDKIIKDFLGEELPRKGQTDRRVSKRKKPENYTDEDIYMERMAGATLDEMAEKLGTTRIAIRQAEQRHMARNRKFVADARENAARTMAGANPKRLSSSYEEFLKKPESERTERENVRFLGPLFDADKRLSSGKKPDASKPVVEGDLPDNPLDAERINEMYARMAEELVSAIEELIKNPQNKKGWNLPWRTPEFYGRNIVRGGRIYQGMNQLILSHVASRRNYKTNRWAGETQWKEIAKNATPKPGETGTNILVPMPIKDAMGIPTGRNAYKVEKVFNADQMDGLPAWVYEVKEEEKLSDEQRLQDIENVIKEIAPKYKEQGFRAFYNPATDEIFIPEFGTFKDPIGFYATLLHEIAHWTGHPSRLNRDQSGSRGKGKKEKEKYAFEELIAEMGSSFAMGFLGLEPQIREDHIEYLAGWLESIRNKPEKLREALVKAQQAVDYIMNKSETLRKRAGVPDDERKGKQDYTIEVPIVGKLTIPVPKKNRKEIRKPKQIGPTTRRGGLVRPTYVGGRKVTKGGWGQYSKIKEELDRAQERRLSSGIFGPLIRDGEDGYFDQTNKRFSSGEELPPILSVDGKRKVKRMSEPMQPKFGLKFEPTREQKDIMDMVEHFVVTGEGGIAAVRAGAGTGKTTTVELAVQRQAKATPDAKFYYITFNRKNAKEAQHRLPDNTGAASINQLAYWSLIMAEGHRVPEKMKDKLKVGGLGRASISYIPSNPKANKPATKVGFNGVVVDTTGLRKVGFKHLGYFSFEAEGGGNEIMDYYDIPKQIVDGKIEISAKVKPKGQTQIVDNPDAGQELALDASQIGYVILQALTRYSQSDDDELSEKHFQLRPHEIERLSYQVGRGEDVSPEQQEFESIPKSWVKAAQQAWKDINDPNSPVIPAYDHQVKMWALTKPNLRTDRGMVSHSPRTMQNADGKDKTPEGQIVVKEGEEYVRVAGQNNGFRKLYASPDDPLDVFFFDEAQDVNPVLQKVIDDNVKENGLAVVMVGDPRQSIYGFRGATDSFEKLKPDFNLTLQQSFRYGKTIALLGMLMLGRGNVADREKGVPDYAADAQLYGALQDVVRADFNIGKGKDRLKGKELATKLDKIQEKYSLTGPKGENLKDLPDAELDQLLSEAGEYLAAEAEGIIYETMPTNAEGTTAYISFSNRNSVEGALQYLVQPGNEDKIVGLPQKKYQDLVAFLRHYAYIMSPLPGQVRPKQSKLIGDAWTAAEFNRRINSQSVTYGQARSMTNMLRQLVDPETGQPMFPNRLLERLLGRYNPETGEVEVRARIIELDEFNEVAPFKNPDGTSPTVSAADLVKISQHEGKGGKGGKGKAGEHKKSINDKFLIIPNVSGMTPSREIFWKLDTGKHNEGGKWTGGVLISGEAMFGVHPFRKEGKDEDFFTGKNMEPQRPRRLVEQFIKDHPELAGKIEIREGYVPKKGARVVGPKGKEKRISNAEWRKLPPSSRPVGTPDYDALWIKGDDDEETGRILSLVGKMLADAANEPEAEVSFLTGHDAKGLEFTNVIVGNDFFRPVFSPDGTRVLEDINREHENLIYVVLTRAKKRIQLPQPEPSPDGSVQEGALDWLLDPVRNAAGYRYVNELLKDKDGKPDKTRGTKAVTGFWRPRFEEPKVPKGARVNEAGSVPNFRSGAELTQTSGIDAGSRENRRGRRVARVVGRGMSSGSNLGRWERDDTGMNADAPLIDGSYSVARGEDGKFYVTRFSDQIRNGGQEGVEYEHDESFGSMSAAKNWAKRDYERRVRNMGDLDDMPDSSEEEKRQFYVSEIMGDENLNPGIKKGRKLSNRKNQDGSRERLVPSPIARQYLAELKKLPALKDFAEATDSNLDDLKLVRDWRNDGGYAIVPTGNFAESDSFGRTWMDWLTEADAWQNMLDKTGVFVEAETRNVGGLYFSSGKERNATNTNTDNLVPGPKQNRANRRAAIRKQRFTKEEWEALVARGSQRLASGGETAPNPRRMAGIADANSPDDIRYAMRLWQGFRRNGITLDTNSKTGQSSRRISEINGAMERVGKGMQKRIPVTIGKVSENAKTENPNSSTWMLPVKKLKEAIRIPTDYQFERDPEGSVRNITVSNTESISNEKLGLLLGISAGDIEKLNDEDAGISADSVRSLISEIGNQPEFVGFRLFSPVTDDEPETAGMSEMARFAENLARQEMRERFIIETFGKDAYPRWVDREENEVISQADYESLGEVDQVGKFRAIGTFAKDIDEVNESNISDVADELLYEGMNIGSPYSTAAGTVIKSGPKTQSSDFPLEPLLEYLGIDRKEWATRLRERLIGAYGTDDVGLEGGREGGRRWVNNGVPIAHIREMIRTGLIPDAKSVWKSGPFGERLDGELNRLKPFVIEALNNFVATVPDSTGNKKIGANDLGKIFGGTRQAITQIVQDASRKKGNLFSSRKGDEPRYSESELSEIVERFNEMMGTSHTIDDIFSEEQLQAARKKLESGEFTKLPNKNY